MGQSLCVKEIKILKLMVNFKGVVKGMSFCTEWKFLKKKKLFLYGHKLFEDMRLFLILQLYQNIRFHFTYIHFKILEELNL